MLTNFQLSAIVKAGGQTQLYQIPLHRELQESLAISWQAQYDAFVEGIVEIDFNPGYTPEGHERFRLREYELPDFLDRESSLTISALDPISAHEDIIDSITGIVAFARNEQNEEIILFQNFSRSHVIRPGRFLLLQNNTYKSTQRPGMALDGKLSAIYIPANGNLLFQNFRITNTFLPLATFYEEASEHDILDVLNHDLFAPEDADGIAVGANQWFRKRFAMLRDSGILDRYTAQEITNHSQGYDINIQLDGDRIIFPTNKTEAKRLLQFLNEEIFKGAITETLYETNSKREAD